MGKIILSEKHGVNPSLDICPICEKPRGVILFGRLPGDAEAPRKSVSSLFPCDECRTAIGDGIVCYRAVDKKPSGPILVLQKDAFHSIFGETPEKGVAFLDAQVFDVLLSQAKEAQ